MRACVCTYAARPSERETNAVAAKLRERLTLSRRVANTIICRPPLWSHRQRTDGGVGVTQQRLVARLHVVALDY